MVKPFQPPALKDQEGIPGAEAERAGGHGFPDKYVYQRHVFAYKAVPPSASHNKLVLELECGEGYGMEMLCRNATCRMAADKKKPAQINLGGNLDFRR
jgi:hypothetical protein